ncbi:hypothetical protein F4677DRAFT_464761 [Hypoxylon crocopeplum]|nr:hypothetical protein F4677DRAFT_464761 [Hypoxylon crocopeplum]
MADNLANSTEDGFFSQSDELRRLNAGPGHYSANGSFISTVWTGASLNDGYKESRALALCFSALTTLVVLLIYVDGRPLEQWNGSISLNAVVSSLGAVSRTSLAFAISSCLGQVKWNWFRKRPDNLVVFDRFDDASRGPWGSLWLIIWIRTCHWVTIGAAVTIILIGFEPFLQAVVSFSGQMDPLTGPSTIRLGYIEAIDVGAYFNNPGSPIFAIMLTPSNPTVQLGPYDFLPDLGMLSSFSDGF